MVSSESSHSGACSTFAKVKILELSSTDNNRCHVLIISGPSKGKTAEAVCEWLRPIKRRRNKIDYVHDWLTDKRRVP
jgi:hypothetical protein